MKVYAKYARDKWIKSCQELVQENLIFHEDESMYRWKLGNDKICCFL